MSPDTEIQGGSRASGVFIPIVTPRAVNSHYYKFEFEAFLTRENALGRTDLVFPLLYIRVPVLESEADWRKDPLLSISGLRQYVDWRRFRHADIRGPPSAKRLSTSARKSSRHDLEYCRSAYRGRVDAVIRSLYAGFRVARTLF
jgi:hypothetical protein